MIDVPTIPAADDEDDLLTPNERERLQHSAIAERNARRERARRALMNRERGLAEPKPGDALHVSIARGISQRNRAGITFVKNKSTKVEIVDCDPATLARRQKTENVVDVHGAEMILEDDALIARQSPGGDEDLLAARATISAHETEIARLTAELAAARAGVKRDARRSADGDNDAAPTRLRAAKAAAKEFDKQQAASGSLSVPEPGFAGPGAPSGAELTDFIAPDKR